MFNSAAMFVGRRCSSQLDIPTLWIKDDDEEKLTSSARNTSRSRRPSFEVSHQYHSRAKRRNRHSLPMSSNINDPPRRTSMFLIPSTPSTVLAGSPLTPSDFNTILHAETIMLKPTGGGMMANEVSDELPILNPIHYANHRSSEPDKGSKLVGNILATIRQVTKGDKDRYSLFNWDRSAQGVFFGVIHT